MKLSRHKKSDMFMCLSFFVTFFILFVVLSYMNKIMNAEENEELHSYVSQCNLVVTQGTEKMDLNKVLEQADGLHGLIIIDDVGMAVDSSGKEYLTSVILFNDEGYKYSTYGDKLGYADKSSDKDVVIGKDFSEYVNNNKISLDGVEYSVVAVDYNKSDSEYDYSILTWYEDITEFTKEKIESSEALSIRILSDRYQATEIFNNLKDIITGIYPDSRVYIEENEISLENYNETAYVEYYFMVYLFCVLNCMIAAQFWIMERKREIAIRKAYGFSSMKIFKILYLEFTKIATISMGICFVFKVLTDKISNKAFVFELSVFNLLFLVVAILLTSLVAILIPIITASNAVSIDQVIKKGQA